MVAKDAPDRDLDFPCDPLLRVSRDTRLERGRVRLRMRAPWNFERR